MENRPRGCDIHRRTRRRVAHEHRGRGTYLAEAQGGQTRPKTAMAAIIGAKFFTLIAADQLLTLPVAGVLGGRSARRYVATKQTFFSREEFHQYGGCWAMGVRV